MIDKDFLLKVYGQCYDPDAGPWNLSKTSKYLEYAIIRFFEDNFEINEHIKVCNIGIGCGDWDRYLSYRIGEKGTLTSIDIDPLCCRQLSERLENERNPNKVEVICSDVTKLQNMSSRFDLVTMIGSTRLESGFYTEILKSAVDMLEPNGEFYYMTLDKSETMNDFVKFSASSHLVLQNYLYESKYGYETRYWKAVK